MLKYIHAVSSIESQKYLFDGCFKSQIKFINLQQKSTGEHKISFVCGRRNQQT